MYGPRTHVLKNTYKHPHSISRSLCSSHLLQPAGIAVCVVAGAAELRMVSMQHWLLLSLAIGH
jgi:hypothetical protein